MANQNQGGGNQPRHSQGGGQPARHLTFDLTEPTPDGDLHKVVATAWYKENNRPKKGTAILFYLDGIDLQNPVLTDAEGRAVAVIAELEPGPHSLAVKVQGWGSPVTKTVRIEGKKESKAAKNVAAIRIHAERLHRDSSGTHYRILLEAIDKDENGVPGRRFRVSDPCSPNGFTMTEPTGDDGSVVFNTIVCTPVYLFTVATDGASNEESLFDWQPYEKPQKPGRLF
jgi:hypothetical protein